MFLRHLNKLSPVLEGLVPRAHCIRAPCFYHARDVKVTGKSNSVSDRDWLASSLESLPADQLISTLEAKKHLITGSHIVIALDKLTKHFKHYKEIEQGRHLIEELTSVLDHNKNKLSGQQTCQVVEMLDQLGVLRDSKIYPAMKQHIIDCVNDSSLKQFCELADAIKTTNHSIRYDLDEVLDEKFEFKLSMDFDENNIEHLQYALYFISQISWSRKKQHSGQDFMRKICNLDQTIPIDSAMSIYSSLHFFQYCQLKVDALQKVQNDLAEQGHLLTLPHVMEIAKRLSPQKNHPRITEYYNEKLADALARRVINGKFGFGITIIVLRRLYQARHQSTELLDYCCAAILRESRDSQEKIKLIVSITPELAAIMSHRTEFWGEIQNSVRKYAKNFRGKSEDLIYLASDLMSLGWFSNPIMGKVFDGSFRPSNVDNKCQIFRTMYQRLKLDPSYTGPLPTDSQIADLELMMQKVQKVRVITQLPLLIHLNEAIGDPACVQTIIRTHFFHEINYVVAFHQDGTPAPIGVSSSTSGASDDIKYIEDLTVPAGAKLVIVELIRQSWYFRNTNKLLGHYQLYVDALELLPYPVVFINGLEWSKLPVNERTSFLMNAIRAKLDSAKKAT